MKIIVRFVFMVYVLLNAVIVIGQDRSAAEQTGDLSHIDVSGDTTVYSNKFKTDVRIQAYRNYREFAYMKYLDSLLRNTKNLTVDTFSAASSNSIKPRKNTIREQEQKTSKPLPNIFSQSSVKVILWVLAILLIPFIGYKLFHLENFFKRERTYTNTDQTEQKEEDLTDFSAYNRLIAEATKNKNYRLAIRYFYLQTLQRLTDAGLLQFSADKTNYQYVTELQGKAQQKVFAALTLNYEYVWYGKFNISEEAYKELSEQYKSFQQKV